MKCSGLRCVNTESREASEFRNEIVCYQGVEMTKKIL